MVIGSLRSVREAQPLSQTLAWLTCFLSAWFSRPLLLAFLMLTVPVGASAQASEEPISLVVVLDATSSMAGRMDEARKALMDLIRASSPQSESALVVIHDEPQVAVHLGESGGEIERVARTVQADGFGTMWDGIYLGLKALQNSRCHKKAMVVISDDGDNYGRHTPSELTALLKKSGVRVYAIGTFDRYANRFQARMRVLQIDQAISPTGGRMVPADDFSCAADQVSRELRHQ